MDIAFDAGKHIRNVLTSPEVKLVDSRHQILPGILGTVGAGELIADDTPIGVDRLIMESGSRFELHTHPGAHILYVLRSRGFIHIDGVDYEMGRGDTVFVPADYAHGVRTDPQVHESLEILAFGVPHMPLESAERMTLVEEPVPRAAGAPGDDELLLVLGLVRGRLADPHTACGPAEADVPLIELGFDSLRSVELLVHLEAALGIELPADLITPDTFRTARTIAATVRTLKRPHG
ncbi:cupin domain-containing protein [Streptomyces sp. NPDC001770]